ncbi:MAG TPA: DegT/DnrJ/EryC1/StrS family aminotransferase [Rhizomicrobium sp.]|nr:DegT/DnrJ/EryC1/StrS family aminotransferase [Rhizomicrobium sp.]
MIPVCEPLIGDNVLPLVQDCVVTGWVSSEGKYIAEFERKWAEYCGVKYGVAVSNGSVALELAIEALHLEPGSEIILPSFTIIACARAVVRMGHKPVLVDCDPVTWCMDLDETERKITPKTRAIMPVHMYGHPVDMRRLMEIAKKHDLRVVEDVCEAHGAEIGGRRMGSYGDINCFSFYANKVITTGEGGMITTDNKEYADRVRSLRNQCFLPEQRFLHRELGYNYRLTNVQAAMGVAQTDRIGQHIEIKRWMAAEYTKRLAGLNQLTLITEASWAKSVFWMYCVVLDESVPFDAKEFAARLKAKGVDTRPMFLGMHEQPAFHKLGLFVGESYPVSERLARRGLYLPSGLTLTIEQIDQVCEAVRETLR